MKRWNPDELSMALTEQLDIALQKERAKEKKRNYLGSSGLGKSCDRALQFEYLHIDVDLGKEFSGTLLRTFEAGHVFEDLMAKWIRMAGFNLHTETSQGEQYGYWAMNGRLQGHVDGIISSGPPTIHALYPCLWESKSLKASSWRDTKKKGVALSKPVYAAQISMYQAYMAPTIPGIEKNPALFTAINKDTSEIYWEWVPFNGQLAQRISDRSVNIIHACDAGEWLPRVSRYDTHMDCKMCPWRARCWEMSR